MVEFLFGELRVMTQQSNVNVEINMLNISLLKSLQFYQNRGSCSYAFQHTALVFDVTVITMATNF